MKKFLLLWCLWIFIIPSLTFAITQKVNSADGVNYGYIKDIKDNLLSIDYIQAYSDPFEYTQAKLEDWCYSSDLESGVGGLNYDPSLISLYKRKDYKSYMSNWLVKYGKKRFDKLTEKISEYNWKETLEERLRTKLSTEEKLTFLCSPIAEHPWMFQWWYTRNISPKIRNIYFDKSLSIEYCIDSRNEQSWPGVQRIENERDINKFYKNYKSENWFLEFTLKEWKISHIKEITKCSLAW